MRLNLAFFLLISLCFAGVVDRVAIVIDKTVITESEVLDELRLTAFLNNQPLDVSPAARRAAGERLVDQELIRREMRIGGYSQPSSADADALLRGFNQEHFHTPEEYRAALQKYSITEDALKQRLLWQVTAIQFTDLRFRPLQPAAGSQSADRASDDTASASVDQQMDAWLKEARSNSKIAFKQEAFQ
jgi:hypothetical protein